MSLAAAPVLEYAHGSTRRTSSRADWILLLFSLPALVNPFLTFTWHVSPLDAVMEGSPFDSEYLIFILGVTFFIAFPFVLWKAFNCFREPAPLIRKLAWTLAIACLLPALAVSALVWFEIARDNSSRPSFIDLVHDVWPWLCGPVALVGALLISIRMTRFGDAVHAIDATFIAAFLGNTVSCLVIFYDDPGWGYYGTLYIAALWSLHLLFHARLLPQFHFRDPHLR